MAAEQRLGRLGRREGYEGQAYRSANALEHALCGREVTDRVRVNEASALRHDSHARGVVKGARWLRPSYPACAMRGALRDLWCYGHCGYAACV